jgi:hypothetical protein
MMYRFKVRGMKRVRMRDRFKVRGMKRVRMRARVSKIVRIRNSSRI